ncbi:hypothetical protein [Nostoc sp.]
MAGFANVQPLRSQLYKYFCILPTYKVDKIFWIADIIFTWIAIANF